MNLKGFNFKEDWATTATGVVLAVVTIITIVGLVTTEQGAELQTQLGVIITAGSQIVAAVSAIVLMFTKKE
jgi:hypothetical protein